METPVEKTLEVAMEEVLAKFKEALVLGEARGGRKTAMDELIGKMKAHLNVLDPPLFAMLPERVEAASAVGSTPESLKRSLPSPVHLGKHPDVLGKNLLAYCVNRALAAERVAAGTSPNVSGAEPVVLAIEDKNSGRGKHEVAEKATDADAALARPGNDEGEFLVECKSLLSDTRTLGSYNVKAGSKVLGGCHAYFVVAWETNTGKEEDGPGVTPDTEGELEHLLPLLRSLVFFDTEELRGHKLEKPSFCVNMGKLNLEVTRFSKRTCQQLKVVFYHDAHYADAEQYTPDSPLFTRCGQAILRWYRSRRASP
jgi:hypothetical protein